jgi:hypothetical protein
VTVRGSLPKSKISTYLREIVAERWGTAPTVREDASDAWHIHATDESLLYFRLSVWVRNPRKIEMRRGLGDFSSWLHAHVQDALAKRINGPLMSDDADRRALLDDLYERTIKHVPPELFGVR